MKSFPVRTGLHTVPAVEVHAAPIPPVLPGYSVGRLLGRGGTAQVWLVTEVGTGKTFAAKIIGPGVLSGHHRADKAEAEAVDLAAALRRELLLLTRLSHPHLVHGRQILDLGGMTVLLMDFAAGGSLADLVAVRGPLPIEEVVTIMTPISGCVAYLHANGITHSDLSPGNVLLTESGKPLLADLGVSRIAGEGAALDSGTVGFADPYVAEADVPQVPGQATDEPPVLPHLLPGSDVYALGALTWYALTGRVPAATSRRPPLSLMVPGLPEELILLIESALHAEIDRRPTAGAFERTIFHCAEAAPVDLSETAHESIRPQLLTRRDVREIRRRTGALSSLFGIRPRQTLHRTLARSPRQMPRRRWVPVLLLGCAGMVAVALILASGGGRQLSGTGGPAPNSAGVQRAGAMPPESTGKRNPTLRTASAAAIPAAASPSTSRDATLAELQHELSSADPVAAARALAKLRASALNSASYDLLRKVNFAGSPAMAADQQLVEQLRQHGQQFGSLDISLTAAEVLSSSSEDSALVAATVVVSAYWQQTVDGATVHRKGGEQELILALRFDQGRWLIDRVLTPAEVE